MKTKTTILCHLFVTLAAMTAAILPASLFAAPGDLYEADSLTRAIYKFTPDGTQSNFAPFSLIGLPVALAFDGNGNLFEADANGAPNGTIFTYTPDGTQSVFAFGLNSPSGLAFDALGNLFEADLGSGTIFKFTPTGTKSTFASGLNSPHGLAFDAQGNLFEADSGSGTIFKFTPSGTKSTFVTGLGDPTGLAFDSSGNLFGTVNDGAAIGMILKFTPDGTMSTFFVTSSALGVRGLAFQLAHQLRNISTRGFVGTGDSVLIGGFILGGTQVATNTVVVRALGPTLTKFGVAGALQDPTLQLVNSSGVTIATNNNWKDTQQVQIQATGLAPPDDRESAIYATPPAGNYTAIVAGVNNTTGVALVEVYNLQ